MTIDKVITALKSMDSEEQQQLLEKMPEKSKLILALICYDNLNFQEISNILGHSEKEIIQLVMDAMRKVCIRLA
jgi:DNA-directed RNA polymerase specialized sigma subunit